MADEYTRLPGLTQHDSINDTTGLALEKQFARAHPAYAKQAYFPALSEDEVLYRYALGRARTPEEIRAVEDMFRIWWSNAASRRQPEFYQVLYGQ